MGSQKTLSSGDVAKYCDVNLRTVIRWIEKGHLKAHKLPGRGNNRILVPDFLKFLTEHEMPVPKELSDTTNKILVIDDEPAMASAIKRVLKKAGFQIETASDGLEAGVKLSEFQPSLLILDLMMPNMNGFEVLKFLRNSQFSSIKVIVLSGAGDDKLDKALSLGANIAMAKPFENDELLAKVQNLIGSEAVII
ncbi:response regulator [Pleionea sp. CnH1-48]|uniref:response regulator n=1 Tax=Pleionea sp. CnH1-48 TaxID=2954494 RepID=UPI002097CC23|nr:response regulator [Pleionea sp. CnH1-48]MCO7223739.1 response regulator [Pleionea sp. CnH1-48]